MDPVGKKLSIEIYDEPNGSFCKLHVGEDLCLMNTEDVLNRHWHLNPKIGESTG